MNDIKYGFYYFGPFLTMYNVDLDIISELLEMSNSITFNEETDYRDQLAGKIGKEVKYNQEQQDIISNHLTPYFNSYLEALLRDWNPTVMGHLEAERIISINPTLESVWVNYQVNSEYNPIHSHSGDISFVLYLDIPEVISQEVDITRSSPPGAITFYHTLHNGYFRHPVDRLLEPVNAITHTPVTGQMFVFPSWLSHEVQAFKSDVTRVSMAGNLNVVVNK